MKHFHRSRTIFLSVSLACALAAAADRSVVIDGLKFTVDSSGLTTVTHDSKDLVDVVIPPAVTIDGTSHAVTCIGEMAFFGCREIATLTLPSSINSIGPNAFLGCTKMTAVNIGDISDWYGITFANGFSNPLANAHSLFVGGQKITDLVIPEGMTVLSDNMFAGCDITSVTFPSTLTTIGQLCFYECKSLTDVTLPPSVEFLRTSAFDSCTALKSFTGGASLKTLQSFVFNGCEALETVSFEPALDYIGADSFKGCTSLKRVEIKDVAAWAGISFMLGDSNPLTLAGMLYVDGEPADDIVLPADVTQVSDAAFRGCTSLKSVAFEGKGITVCDMAFENCTQLSSIDLADVISIGYRSFNGCEALNEADLCSLSQPVGSEAFSGCKTLTAVTVPESVTEIGDYAFYDCLALRNVSLQCPIDRLADGVFGNCAALEHIELPPLSSIGFGAFYGCSSLSEISIEGNGLTIGKSAFNGCSSMKSLTLTGTVSTIKDFAFTGCPSLETVTNLDGEPATLSTKAFDSYTAKLLVRKEDIEAYRNAPVWCNFEIAASPMGVDDTVGDSPALIISGNTLTSSDGSIEVFTIDGRAVTPGRTGFVTLAPGIYIVRCGRHVSRIRI